MENFYLEQNEELFSIIDRIKRSRDDNITLIIPRGLSALRSIINLRLLKEEAISFGKSISIITSDVLIKKLAQQSGLDVLDKMPKEEIKEEIKPSFVPTEVGATEGKKVMSDIVIPVKKTELPTAEELPTPVGIPTEVGTKPFDRSLDDLGDKEDEFEELFVEPQPTADQPQAGAEDTFSKKDKPSFRFFTKKRIVAFFVIIGLIVGGFILYFVLPRAKVVINPKKETVRFETEILADKNIDSVVSIDNSIPGQIFQLEMEDSKKFPTTGEKDIEEKAKGKIMIHNQYSSSDQTLVKTTRFLSEDGKIFRLIETTIIPGATIEKGEIIPNSKEIEVEADEAGESYNIGPSSFTIPGFKGTVKYNGFYGESIESMKGGAKGKMRVVTKDDIEGATEIVSLELKNKVEEQFNKKIPTELKLLEDSRTLEIIESDSTLEIDEPGKEFVITVKVVARALAFQEDDILYLVEKDIAEKISENKILLPSTIQVNYSVTEVDLINGKANFSCQVEADVAWKIDEKEIKDNLAGMDEIGVRKYLSSLSEIEGARVIFWPFWVKKIPTNKDKIKVIVEAE